MKNLISIIFALVPAMIFCEEITFTADFMSGTAGSKTDTTTLEGNATVQTSSMNISADAIELSGEDFRFITATGTVSGSITESQMDFTCGKLKYDRQTKVAQLEDAVHLVDVANEVTADAQIIEYNQNSETAVMQIEITLTQKDNVCTSAFAIYKKSEQKLEMSGNPKIQQGTDSFRAQEITLNLETQEITLDGRVKGTVSDSKPAKTETDTESAESETASQAENPPSDSEIPPQTENSQKIHTLKVNSLYKSFGRKKVVQGVDFQMHTGEVLGLLGPNGAGKTTSFYMIVGFYQPTSGEIFLDDERITDLPMYKRARLGISYLPQEPSVFRKLTVEENIWSILETRQDLTRAEKRQRLEELIEEFSIGRIRKQPAFTLSGGERRRTEIARSLAIEPKFLLLDEPFAGIDPIAVADIKAMIKLLAKRGIGILITDHNVRDTLEITDRAIIISTGQILIQGSQQDIIDSPVAREIYLGENFHM